MFHRLILLAALALVLQAADLTGIWSGEMTGRKGEVHDVSFRLIQKDGAISGKMYGDNESTPLSDVKLEGDRITFSVGSELNGQDSKVLYEGTIKGDEIEMTRERAGAKPEPGKPDPKQQFTLKRVA